MGRKKRGQVVTPGYAWCTKGDHEAPEEEFYRRADGSLRTWCVNCSRGYAKDNDEVKKMLNDPYVMKSFKHLREAIVSDVEDELVEEQERNKWTAPPYDQLVLDWLTPLYVHGPRPDADDQVIYFGMGPGPDID